MRHIVIDTESTGFTKNRLIEVAAMEFDPATGKSISHYHSYVRPGTATVEPGALRVHGLTDKFLSTKPLFATVAPQLQNYLRGAKVYAHNASYDKRTLNTEFSLITLPSLESIADEIVCTLVQAKSHKLPTVNNKLDSLCDHFKIDRSNRTLHGALIDCQLLVQVYLAMEKLPKPLLTVKNKEKTLKSPTTDLPDKPKREGWRPGGPWYDDEKQSLQELYVKNGDIAAICEKHNRSFTSIVMQMVKQNIISQDQCDILRAEKAIQEAQVITTSPSL